MIAVIYSTLNGTSEKYAKMLGRRIYLPVYPLGKSKTYLERKDEIVYVGWVRNGKIVGLNKVRRLYKVRAVCAVGMEVFSQQKIVDLTRKNKVDVPLYYIQGGLYMNRLKGLNRMRIKGRVEKEILRLESVVEKTQSDMLLLQMYKNGADFVNEVNLASAIDGCLKLPPLD